MPKRFLLLNPPGRELLLRDYYCSSISKGDYYWHPGDLLFQSGILAQRFDVHIIDAIAENLSEADTIRKIETIHPDYVLFLAGAASWPEDFAFAKLIDAKAIFASGEIFMDGGKPWLAEHDFLSGALHDFTSQDILHWIDGDFDAITNMTFRQGEEINEVITHKGEKTCEIPIPLHEKFTGRYRMPFMRHRRFASLLTDFGCRHNCAFCNSGALGYKTRTKENLQAEIEHIRHLGIEQVFIKDMSFAADRKHAQMVLPLLEHAGFSWNCYARVDDLDTDLLVQMKNSGCFLIQFGLEHSEAAALDGMGKKNQFEKARSIFRVSRELGINVGVHLIIGLPGETANTLKALEQSVKTLEADYLSLNLAAPRYGSRLRKGKQSDALPDRHEVSLTLSGGSLPEDILWEGRKEILKAFYGRPEFLVSQLKGIKSFQDLLNRFANGYRLALSLATAPRNYRKGIE